MTSLTIPTSQATNLVPSLEISRLADLIVSRLVQIDHRIYSLPADSPISAVDRASLKDRYGALDRLLSPADKRRIGSEINQLFLGYPARKRSEEELTQLIAKYTSALQGAPIWALTDVCRAISTGKLGDPSYPPTAPQIVSWVDRHLETIRSEYWKLHKILNARVEPPLPSPEERARAISRADALVSDLRGTNDAAELDKQKRRQEAAERSAADRAMFRREEWLALGIRNPPDMSVSMARSLGKMPVIPERFEYDDDERRGAAA